LGTERDWHAVAGTADALAAGTYRFRPFATVLVHLRVQGRVPAMQVGECVLERDERPAGA